MTTFWLKAISLIVGSCLLAAWVSRLINQEKAPWGLAVVASVLTGLVWGWLVRQKVNLIHASIIFDVTMATTYVVMLWGLGEPVTPLQVVGIVLALLGVGIMGWA